MKLFKTMMAGAMMAAFTLTTPVFAADKGLVGISMPTKSSTRWISDGESMVKEFEAMGYATDLQYGEDDIPNQLAQIENMVTKGAKVLVIASIDGSTLSDILAKAQEAGVKVIAYDRLITKTANVDYYTTFDNFGVGVLQANTLSAHQEGRLVQTDVGPMHLLEGWLDLRSSAGEAAEVLIPPEGLTFNPDPDGEAWVLGREFLGHDWAYLVQWGERRLRLHLPLEVLHSRGQRGHVELRSDASGWLFPGGARLRARPSEA